MNHTAACMNHTAACMNHILISLCTQARKKKRQPPTAETTVGNTHSPRKNPRKAPTTQTAASGMHSQRGGFHQNTSGLSGNFGGHRMQAGFAQGQQTPFNVNPGTQPHLPSPGFIMQAQQMYMHGGYSQQHLPPAPFGHAHVPHTHAPPGMMPGMPHPHHAQFSHPHQPPQQQHYGNPGFVPQQHMHNPSLSQGAWQGGQAAFDAMTAHAGTNGSMRNNSQQLCVTPHWCSL